MRVTLTSIAVLTSHQTAAKTYVSVKRDMFLIPKLMYLAKQMGNLIQRRKVKFSHYKLKCPLVVMADRKVCYLKDANKDIKQYYAKGWRQQLVSTDPFGTGAWTFRIFDETSYITIRERSTYRILQDTSYTEQNHTCMVWQESKQSPGMIRGECLIDYDAFNTLDKEFLMEVNWNKVKHGEHLERCSHIRIRYAE